jgi:hypothetical protein
MSKNPDAAAEARLDEIPPATEPPAEQTTGTTHGTETAAGIN